MLPATISFSIPVQTPAWLQTPIGTFCQRKLTSIFSTAPLVAVIVAQAFTSSSMLSAHVGAEQTTSVTRTIKNLCIRIPLLTAAGVCLKRSLLDPLVVGNGTPRQRHRKH